MSNTTESETPVEQPRLVIRTAFYEASISHERADSLFRFLLELGYSAKVTQSGGTFTIEGEKIQTDNETNPAAGSERKDHE